MSIWVTILLFVVGLVLIVKGGDWFLDGAVWIAEATGVPHFIIGATVVSLATTLPELTVSIIGVMEGEVDLAVGNAVGSVTANLGLILGISALCMPTLVSKKHFSLKAILMVAGAALLTLLCRGGVLPILPSLTMFVVFALYLWNNVADARASVQENRAEHPARRKASRRKVAGKIGMFLLGCAAIVLGSRLLIDYGSELALLLGVPASIVGVTMVAIGTSQEGGVHVRGQHHRRECHRPDAHPAALFRCLGRQAHDQRADDNAGSPGVSDAVLRGGAAAAAQGKVLPLAGPADARHLRGLYGHAGACLKGRSLFKRGGTSLHSARSCMRQRELCETIQTKSAVPAAQRSLHL